VSNFSELRESQRLDSHQKLVNPQLTPAAWVALHRFIPKTLEEDGRQGAPEGAKDRSAGGRSPPGTKGEREDELGL
jgi:hypothetical protein